MRTPKNIVQHELIGLRCRVVAARNAAQVGISGVIRDETMKTLVIGAKRVEKEGSTFRVWLDGKAVDIEGRTILARPEDRIKKMAKKW
ncbi:MAG: ribonuclease P protein subunit [Candidatus Aenigmatarchaeota archaeon]